jgi:hypothetical protein
VSAADVEKIRKDAEERIRREYADKSAAEQAAAAKAAADKLIQEKQAALKAAQDKALADKLAADKAAADKALAEKLAAAKSAGERAAIERVAAEKAAAEKAAAEKLAADKAAAERLAAEKAAAEKAAAAKAAAAARPGWPSVGDRWTYNVQEATRPEKRYQALFEVRSVSQNSIVEHFSAPGVASDHRHGASPSMTGIASGFANFSPYLRAFHELRAGQEWQDIEGRRLWACETSSYLSCKVNVRVAGREKIAVPAGTFDAWKVEVELLQGGQGWAAAAGYNRGTVLFTFWFAEDAKRYVKARSKTMDLWAQPDLDIELASYTPAGAK